MDISKEFLSDFANIFNRSYMIEFINKKNPISLKNLILKSGIDFNLEMKYFEFFERIYDILRVEYRCEYIYLNEIFLNEILKGHSENAKVFTEFTINSSKLDFLIVNGTTTAYEIKTELDNLQRLEKQLEDYVKAFEKVYVVTYFEFAIKIKDFLKNKKILKKVGIKILDINGKLVDFKESGSFIRNFDKNTIFKTLLKKEKEKFGKDYNTSEKNFSRNSKQNIHKMFITFLNERKRDIDFISKLPNSLKMIGYKIERCLNKSQKEKFYLKLNNKIEF